MKREFARGLCDAARHDDRIWLLTGDLGYAVLDEVAAEFPGRFVNGGVAEQNMMTVAAGLAATGQIPFTYSIANFATARCLEQIRNDICYPGLAVNIVSVGAGRDYGTAGYTHHGLEDLAIMGALPHLTIAAPINGRQARELTSWLVRAPGPAYLRLANDPGTLLPAHKPCPRGLVMIRPTLLAEGRDTVLVAAGAATSVAVRAAHLLSSGAGITTSVLTVPILKPFPAQEITQHLSSHRLAVVIEDHGPFGGLGTLVSEAMSDATVPVPLVRFALDSEMRSELRNLHVAERLDPDLISTVVAQHLAGMATGRR